MPFFSQRPTVLYGIRTRRVLPFLFRQVITTGYVAAGYKDNVTWRNVNSNNHSTDTCTNLGDLLQAAANYTSGAHNRNNAFIWGTNGTGTEGNGAYTNTSCFNMRNNTTLTKVAAMNTALTVSDSATLQDMDEDGNYRFSWQNGGQGGAFIQKFNLTTEVHQSTIATSFDQGTIGAAGHFSEFWGYFWNDNSSVATTGKMKFVFATETQSSPTPNVGWHSQQKGLSSKVGKGYAGNEGAYAGGNLFRILNYATETMNANVVKPIQDTGEENFVTGQSKGYALGLYGAPGNIQSNRSFVFNYATDSGSELGASGQPTGTQSGTGSAAGAAIGGRSSGHGYWRD